MKVVYIFALAKRKQIYIISSDCNENKCKSLMLLKYKTQ